MNQQNTIKLLDDTFNHDFDLQRFSQFVKELFNNFAISQKTWTVWSEYQDYIESYVSLGNYTDNSKKVIDVLAVKLKRTSSRDRARTMQRNFIAKYLSNAEKDAALVAFYGDDEDWRFSFVKMEYNLVKDEEGKTKVAKELTPAKRYSFLVGKNEPNHTCKRQFLELVMEDEINPSVGEIESAFSIDNVTKIFFEKYKDLFLRLKEALERVIEQNKNIKDEFNEKNIEPVEFSKKLLGQIVFIYFLQKKGWLGVERDKEWGTGPKDFMNKLFGINYEKPLIHYKNFFNDILEPLFYDALANPREGDDGYYTYFKCKIPFLNGGLFEPINEYNWTKTDILLDNDIFYGIFETFNQFNFTVKEDEPLEKEVAVDPEMLGKVFENLLEVKDRKSKGAFYTPREIVHYMCQQSLINYLETNSSIAREDIENFIQLGDFALAQIIKEQEQIKKYGKSYDVNEKFSIPKSIKENHLLIDKLLKEIKIVDPAVGSGAFPVGMLNEIVKARSILSIYFKEERKNYDLKREIIENCLYGVDIEPSAVEITKLRFWLSLIVDELDMKNIKPLPNLDHKIMCGNSLLEEFEGVKLFDDRLLGEVKKDYSFEIKQIDEKIALLYKEKGDIVRGKKNGSSVKDIEKEIKKLERKKEDIKSKPRENERNLTLGEISEKKIKESQKKLSEHQKLQKEYFDAQNRKVKKQLREDIDRIEWELIAETLKEQGNAEAMQKLKQYKKNKAKPFFLWKLYFAEVFQRENPGFDVVIANPPYVSSWNMNSYEKKYYLKNFESSVGHYDLYILFMEKSFKLLRELGVTTFITSNKYLTQKYGLGIRKILLSNKLNSIVNFNFKIFETATVDTAITLCQKLNINEDYNINLLDVNSPSGFKEMKFNRVKKSLLDETNFRMNLNINKIKLYYKIRESTIPLENICYIDAGVVVHSEKTKQKKEDFIFSKNVSGQYKKYCEGKNVTKNHISKINKYLNYNQKIHHRGKFKELFENKKILIKDIAGASEIVSALDYNYLYVDQTIRICVLLKDLENVNNSQVDTYKRGKPSHLQNPFNLPYIQAILSSRLLSFYFSEFLSDRLHISPHQIRSLPIKVISIEKQKPFIQIVDQILFITKDDDYLKNPDKQAKVKKLEKDIDQLVYKLYELTPEEIKIVEEFCEKK